MTAVLFGFNIKRNNSAKTPHRRHGSEEHLLESHLIVHFDLMDVTKYDTCASNNDIEYPCTFQ